MEILRDDRKWYDLGEYIKRIVSENKKEMIQNAIVVFKDAVSHMHPITSSETAVVLIPFMPLDKAIELLEATKESIEKQISTPYEHINELLLVKMNLCLSRINMDDLSGRESEIVEWKNLYNQKNIDLPVMTLSIKNRELLDYVAFRFYSVVQNVEEAQRHLFSYVFFSKDFSVLETLIKFSIVSKIFFDFSSISTHENFSLCRNENLKNVFLSFQEGNFNQVLKYKKTIIDLIHELVTPKYFEEYETAIFEKVYLINIANTCFRNEDKSIAFSTLTTQLNINEITLVNFLLKALGTEMISGWIDSEKQKFFFNGVSPKGLSLDDIENMKQKFIDWRNKVLKVIYTLKTSN